MERRPLRRITIAALSTVAVISLMSSAAASPSRTAKTRVYVGITSQGHEFQVIVQRQPDSFYVSSVHIVVDARCSDGTQTTVDWIMSGSAISHGDWLMENGAVEYDFHFDGSFGPGQGWPQAGQGTMHYEEFRDPEPFPDGVKVTCASGDVAWSVQRAS